MAKKPKSTKRTSVGSQSDDEMVPVDILKSREEWSEFELSDGTKIRMRPVVTGVRRYKGQFNEDGDPVYQVKSALVFDTQAPANLRKKKKAK